MPVRVGPDFKSVVSDLYEDSDFQDSINSAVAEAGGWPEDRYEAAVATEEQRIALNGVARAAIARAKVRNKETTFTTKGVDHLGTSDKLIYCQKHYGPYDPRTQAVDRVLDFDMDTALMEEVEEIAELRVEYPVVDGEVIMGDQTWSELTSNGATDENSDGWYRARSFLESRLPHLVKLGIKDGTLNEKDYVLISNTSTAKNADEYFKRGHLMVSHISYDPDRNVVIIDHMMMPKVDNTVLLELFSRLDIQLDLRSESASEDSSIPFLATPIQVTKGELTHSSADFAFLVDCIASELTGRQHLFGQEVDVVEGNPYAELFSNSETKRACRQKVAQELKADLLEIARNKPNDTKSQVKRAFENARSRLADQEGVSFVRSRYGVQAAEDFLKKKIASQSGDWMATQAAEESMQRSMGDVDVCGSVLSASPSSSSGKSPQESLAYCPRLPSPGDIARCPAPGCRIVRVAGVEGAPRCSRPGCPLEDDCLKSRRLKYEQDEKERRMRLYRAQLAAQKRAKKRRASSEHSYSSHTSMHKTPALVR